MDYVRLHLDVVGAVVLMLLGCVLGRMHVSAPAVSMYMSAKNGVLDLNWDSGPQHLQMQLLQLGSKVEVASEGQPNLALLQPGTAYIIPVQNGPTFYSNAEDMEVVASFIRYGGLVVLLDANHGGGEAQKQFIAKAFNYEGDWGSCKTYTSNEQKVEGRPRFDERAKSFMPSASWPAELEDVQGSVTLRSWCHHTDPMAVSWPLYHTQGDSTRLVAQAHGRIGSPGAVVWLGYSWKDGPQASWGSLIETLLRTFRNGGYQDPLSGAGLPQAFESDSVDEILEKVTNVAQATNNIVRRFLQNGMGSYPPPASPSPPLPTPTPTPQPVTFVKFKKLLGMGVYDSTNQSVVWYDDPDFRNYRTPRSHVNLVFWTMNNNCNFTVGTCQQCPRAWQADTTRNVTILFREPWQLDSIHITQIQNPGVFTVELLPWPAVSIPGLEGLAPKTGVRKPAIWNVTADTTRCGGRLRIPFGQRAGTGLNVPKRGSQERIPLGLRQTTLGGVNIIVKAQPDKGVDPGYTVIESVRFDGRVLYPKDPTVYGPDHP